MAELWGFQAGEQQAQQYTQNQALFNLSMQEGGMKLESEAVSLQTQKLALSQQEMMMNLLKDRQNKQNVKAAQGAAAQPGGQLPGTGPNMDDLAAKADENGDLLAATGQLNASSESYERAASIRRNATEIAKTQADQDAKDLSTTASLLQSAKDKIAGGADPQKVWQDANMQFMSITGRESKVAHLPYSPELLDAALTGSETMLQQAQQKAAAARQKASDMSAVEAKTRVPLIEAQKRVAQDRADALEKGGVLGPKSELVSAAKSYINENYQVDPDNLDIFSLPIAEDAQRRMSQNHLSSSEAVAAAFRSAQAGKTFAGLPAKEFNTTTKDTGGGMFGSMYAARFGQRVIAGATQGLAQLETVSRLGSSAGIPTQGIFRGNLIGENAQGSIKQLMTTSQQKMYNAAMAGLAPELAAAQNQGMAPTETQINNIMGRLTILPTDDAQTGQFKVALLARDYRKALEGGIENMKPAQAARAQELMSQFQEFPDPDVIANAKPGDNLFPPGKFGAKGVAPVGGEPKRISSDVDYSALPSGATFIAPDGTTRRKP